jgi:hypothetical protein
MISFGILSTIITISPFCGIVGNVVNTFWHSVANYLFIQLCSKKL